MLPIKSRRDHFYENERDYFYKIATSIRKFLLDSEYITGEFYPLFQNWIEKIRGLPQGKPARQEFNVPTENYPPRLEIVEEVSVKPARPAGIERTYFRYEWGYDNGEKAAQFPRHAFHSADDQHPEHHFHQNGTTDSLVSININDPDLHPNLVEEFFDWLKKYVTP